MEQNKCSYGSSLLVPSVQELAKDPNLTVPSRYIRHDQDQSLISEHDHALHFPHQVPVIDFQKLISEKSSASEEVEGFGQAFVAFVVSKEQKLDWNDILLLTTLPPHMRKPHLLPKLPSTFRETVETYAIELRDLAMGIIAQIEKTLKLKDKEVTELFEGGNQAMRMNYYPPCPQPDKVVGLTPHSDAVGLTIVLQLNEVVGLQARKNDSWVPIKPLPDAFVVNIGDILEKERLSIATFYNPSFESEIGPTQSLITEKSPPKYRRLGTQEYFKRLFTLEIDRKSYLECMKL
ncbi:hypothetical protein FNV43_RR16250 [Rhamnella rubrinervis]|uniref:Fe2OG dioxygenase domain-containing protein n=1 Tax=Rhamnella rubrinervis TaxID=2594499 RepID=A0A8K0EAG2_9ROSA|nr:hypothetical protein FNV43_RR16250 [Rhamnella rubrinervis]